VIVRDVRMRGFRERTSVADALVLLEARTSALADEEVALGEAAGRIAAVDVVARVSVPHFARAAMDGFALAGESTFGATTWAPVELDVVGVARPGRPFEGRLEARQAVAIATGAPLPSGADAVIMAEHADEVAGADGHRVVRVVEPIAPGKHVGEIGEDVRAGDVVLRAGRTLRPQDVGVLASVGVGSVRAVRRPRVRALITGDELLPPGELPRGARIVDANGPMLVALARRDGAAQVEVEYVEDRREAVREAMARAREEVLLISGGSSVGPEDHAPGVLAEIGELLVHGIAMRPSSPAGFGCLLDSGEPERERMVFLLPGNPVSCLCAYEFFAGPTVRALGGRSRAWPHARVAAKVVGKIVSELGRVDYVRVRLEGDRALAIMSGGASILSSTTRADGVVVVAAELEGYGEGERVEVLLY
jgi:molybdopterin molybdotransferase